MVRHLTWGFRQSATLVVYVIALMWMDLWLALASMVVVPLFSWAAIRFADVTKSASRERRRRAGSLGAITEEHLANAALVQGHNQEATAIERYQQ
jgi:subfamily B ATP-binding cassette protein MsbA